MYDKLAVGVVATQRRAPSASHSIAGKRTEDAPVDEGAHTALRVPGMRKFLPGLDLTGVGRLIVDPKFLRESHSPSCRSEISLSSTTK